MPTGPFSLVYVFRPAHMAGRNKLPATPDEIITVLFKVFGDGDNLPMLQQRFYAYQQREEDLISCSLNMVELYDKIVQLDPSFAACRDASLKGRFADAVKDEGLKRELRRLNIETPGLKFFELRDRAVHWIGRLATDKKSVINQEVQSACKEEEDPTSDLLEVVKRQEALIEKQQQQINSILSKPNNKSGKPRQCWNCGSTNHLRRNCRKPVSSVTVIVFLLKNICYVICFVCSFIVLSYSS